MVYDMKMIEMDCDKNLAIVNEQKGITKAIYRGAMKQVKEVFQKLYEKDKETLDSIGNTSRIIQKECRTLREEFEFIDDRQKFILMKKTNHRIKEFKRSLDSARSDVKISHYGFIPNGSDCNGGPTNKLLGHIFTFPIRLAKIQIETQSDRHHCSISGIALLHGDQLVIADNGNKKIKVFSTTSKTIVAELPLETTPLALTRTGEQNVIVSSAAEKLAYVLNIKDNSIEIAEQIKLDGMCQNVAANGIKYVHSFNDSEKIVFIDTSGNVLKKIDLTSTSFGNPMKPQPKAVTYDAKNEIFYLALSGENRVAMIDSEGDVISHFEAENMKYPISVCLGRNGSVYVCCRDSDNIFELSRDLSIGHEILNENNGLVSPWCIAVCQTGDVLYVGSYCGRYIQIYKL